MQKQVTVARLQKAIQTWLNSRDRLLEVQSELLEIIKGAGVLFPRYASDKQELFSVPAKNEVEQIYRFELNLRGFNTFGDFRQLIKKQQKDIDRVVAKEKQLKAIQNNNKISGIVSMEIRLGSSNTLACWYPEKMLWLTEPDVSQLREERLKIFEFWETEICTKQLQIFEPAEGNLWSSVDLSRVRKMVTLGDYAVINEEISYFDFEKAIEIAQSFTYPNGAFLESILADLTISMPTEIIKLTQLSVSPAKGLKERRLIYFYVGVGSDLGEEESQGEQGGDITNIFCAVNISDILYNR